MQAVDPLVVLSILQTNPPKIRKTTRDRSLSVKEEPSSHRPNPPPWRSILRILRRAPSPLRAQMILPRRVRSPPLSLLRTSTLGVRGCRRGGCRVCRARRGSVLVLKVSGNVAARTATLRVSSRSTKLRPSSRRGERAESAGADRTRTRKTASSGATRKTTWTRRRARPRRVRRKKSRQRKEQF